jgi:hypothetical protein
MPGLNKYFQLVPFPNDEFRDWTLGLLACDVTVTLLFDRVMQLLFAPEILWASMEGTSMRDVIGVLKTLGMIGGGSLHAPWGRRTVGGDDEGGGKVRAGRAKRQASEEVGCGKRYSIEVYTI